MAEMFGKDWKGTSFLWGVGRKAAGVIAPLRKNGKLVGVGFVSDAAAGPGFASICVSAVPLCV
jgi:hypothetical protein